jgi:hypothetical protein
MNAPWLASAVHVLRHADPERLQRGCLLLDLESGITPLLHADGPDVRAFVPGLGGSSYAVVLTPRGSYCSCKDAMYRATICKHAVLLALLALRAPLPDRR